MPSQEVFGSLGVLMSEPSPAVIFTLRQEHPEWILRDERGREVSCGFTAPGKPGMEKKNLLGLTVRWVKRYPH